MKTYYEDSAVTIYHGDCRDILPNVSFDVLVTDPPYGVDLGNHRDSGETRKDVGLKKRGYASYCDTHENLKMIVVPIITKALKRCDRGVVFCAGHRIHDFPRPDAVSGFFLPSGVGRTKWGFQNFAHFLLYGGAPDLHKGCHHTGWASTELCEKNGHPCPKPKGWMHKVIDLATREGETIFDPFMGSGTTLRAAKDLGRKAIGIEIEEKYCEIAANRMAQEVLDL